MNGKLMEKIKHWYFRGYDARKRDIEANVVSQFSRGNVLVQEGYYMTKEELNTLSKEGDRALERLEGAAQ